MAIPEILIVAAVVGAREALIGLTRKHKRWVGQVLRGTGEQTKGGFLAEGQRRIPIRIAGADFNRLTGAEQFNTGAFSIQRTGHTAAGQIERFLLILGGGERPAKLTAAAGEQFQRQRQRRVRARASLRTTRDEKHRDQVFHLPLQHCDRLALECAHALAFEWNQLRHQVKVDRARDDCMVGNRKTPDHDVRGGNPVFGGHIHTDDGGEGYFNKVGENGANTRGGGEFCRIADGFAVFDEARKDAHQPCAQPIGGAQPNRRRITAAQIELPDMVVDVIWSDQTGIGSNRQLKWVARSQVAVAHDLILYV